MLSCSVAATDEAVTVRLDGELWDPRDMETLVSMVQPHVRGGVERVAMDLTDVRQLGLIGLGTLLALRTQADTLGIEFLLTGGSTDVREQLARVGLSSAEA